jgi:hypothetical protein
VLTGHGPTSKHVIHGSTRRLLRSATIPEARVSEYPGPGAVRHHRDACAGSTIGHMGKRRSTEIDLDVRPGLYPPISITER